LRLRNLKFLINLFVEFLNILILFFLVLNILVVEGGDLHVIHFNCHFQVDKIKRRKKLGPLYAIESELKLGALHDLDSELLPD
jgi:hypothetical protein